MGTFNGGYTPNAENGLINLYAVKQVLFCIAQSDSAALELDSHSILGLSNILESAGYEIEKGIDEMLHKEDKDLERHNKLRADLMSYLGSGKNLCKSDIVKILAEDKKNEV